MDQEVKREIIMENYLHPHNKDFNDNKDYIHVNSNNESCIDNIDLYILIKDDIIADIKFNGEACAISTSSTSIMIKELIGKNIREAVEFIKNFFDMLNEKTYDEKTLGMAMVYDDLYKQKNRKNCALLPYKGIIKALDEYERKKS